MGSAYLRIGFFYRFFWVMKRPRIPVFELAFLLMLLNLSRRFSQAGLQAPPDEISGHYGHFEGYGLASLYLWRSSMTGQFSPSSLVLLDFSQMLHRLQVILLLDHHQKIRVLSVWQVTGGHHEVA